MIIPDNTIGHNSLAEKATIKTGICEVSHTQISSFQIGIPKISPSQISSPETNINEGSFAQVRFYQDSIIQPSALQIHTAQVSPTQIRSIQSRLNQTSVSQVRSTQISTTQINFTQTSSLKNSFNQVNTTHTGIIQGSSTQICTLQVCTFQFSAMHICPDQNNAPQVGIYQLDRPAKIDSTKIPLPSSISPQKFLSIHTLTPESITTINNTAQTLWNTLLTPQTPFKINLQLTSSFSKGQLAEAIVTKYDSEGRPIDGTIEVDPTVN